MAVGSLGRSPVPKGWPLRQTSDSHVYLPFPTLCSCSLAATWPPHTEHVGRCRSRGYGPGVFRPLVSKDIQKVKAHTTHHLEILAELVRTLGCLLKKGVFFVKVKSIFGCQMMC